jgi:hypothetical protein
LCGCTPGAKKRVPFGASQRFAFAVRSYFCVGGNVSVILIGGWDRTVASRDGMLPVDPSEPDW